MEIIKINEIKEELSPFGVTIKSLFENEDIVMKNIILKSNEVVTEHPAPNNVLFYVLEGKGTLINNGKEVLVEKDNIISCDKDSLVAIKADKEESLKVLVIRRPGN